MTPTASPGWVLILALPLVSLQLACSKDEPSPSGPKVSVVATSVEVAPGLVPEDYVVYGVAGDREAAVDTSGSASADVFEERPGFVFAAPRNDSPSAKSLAAESGIYLAPYLGYGQRLVQSGTTYAVAKDGPLSINATTTLLSLLMMHPDLTHPAFDVATVQVNYFANRLSRGWPTLTSCAQKYDDLLADGTDPTLDSGFAACVTASLEEVRLDMTVPSPAAQRASTGSEGTATSSFALTALPTRAPRAVAAVVSGDDSSWSSSGIVVSELETKKSGSEVRVEPKSQTGTGLDYLYFVRRLPVTKFPEGKTSAAFVSPELLSNVASSSIVAAGAVPASSYFSYLDVIGNSMNWLADKVGSVTIAPSGGVGLPIPSAGIEYYELRLFSGGYGLGEQASIGQYALDYYSSETKGAFRHNVASALVEILTLIPGADVLLGEDTGAAVVQEATTAAITGLEQLLTTKGAGGITGSDVYDLLYGIAKSTVTKYVDKATEKAQKNQVKRFIKWVGAGGKKAVKFVFSIPAKVAKGGSLANRAFRLANPDSTMELWYIAVGKDGDLQVISGSEHVTGATNSRSCTLSADIAWTVRGIEPKALPDEDGFYSFTVRGGTSGTVSISVSNADCTPNTWTINDTSTGYPMRYYVYTLEGVSRAADSCVFYGAIYNRAGDPIGDVTRDGSFTSDGFDGSFTLPPPAHENDYPHVGIGVVYKSTYTIETYKIEEEGAPPVLVDTATGQSGEYLYFKTVSIEGS